MFSRKKRKKAFDFVSSFSLILHFGLVAGLPDFSWCNTPKRGKYIPYDHKVEWPQIIPNDHKIDQMAIK
jgi:hypothetical protein